MGKRFRWTIADTAIATVVVAMLVLVGIITAPITGLATAVVGAIQHNANVVANGLIIASIGLMVWWSIYAKTRRQPNGG